MGVRYAPSPTGTLHLGNLRTAWISHEIARATGLSWVLRFEDIDEPRVIPGAIERQLEDMRLLGLNADEIRIQSQHRDRHWSFFLRAREEGRVYPCFCSRKEVQRAMETEGIASAPHHTSLLYSGRCRGLSGKDRLEDRHETISWRFRNSEDPRGTRDFIIARTGHIEMASLEGARFVPAYNWACAIDDLDGRYHLVVRCVDLRHVLSQQREIQRWLDPAATLPAVFHTALVVDEEGRRLEKRTKGVTLSELFRAGYSAEVLLERLKKTFTEASLEFKPGAVLGESIEKLSVRQLLGI